MPLGPAHISVTSSTAFFFMPTKVSKFLLLCVDTRHLYFVFFFFYISLLVPWRRKWQPTLLFLPGKSHGWGSLVGYSSWGHKELDMTE